MSIHFHIKMTPIHKSKNRRRGFQGVHLTLRVKENFFRGRNYSRQKQSLLRYFSLTLENADSQKRCVRRGRISTSCNPCNIGSVRSYLPPSFLSKSPRGNHRTRETVSDSSTQGDMTTHRTRPISTGSSSQLLSTWTKPSVNSWVLGPPKRCDVLLTWDDDE